MAKNKKKKKQKKVLSPGQKRVRLVGKVILLLLLLTILAVGVFLYMKYGREALKFREEAVRLVSQSTAETFRQSETSEVYDTNGKLITTLKGEKDTYYLTYDQIPDMAKEAMISIEDKKFRKHIGIDFKAVLRAAKEYIVNKGEITQGGSTITQQLSRNIFLTHEVSWERKVKEIFIAMEIEKKYTKDQIMEFYLNNIYFGSGYYGIQAASKGYFSKEVDELTLSQIAFLCAIPNNPTLYDPFDNMVNTLGRRNRILKQMEEDGVIGEQQFNEASNEEIELNVSKKKKQNYIETYVYNSAIKALMKNQGFTFRYTFGSDEEKERYQERYDDVYSMCQQSLYSAGYRIYTSIDTKKQKQLQKTVDETLADFKSKNDEGIYELQSAATCIDNETGKVVAIVGGRSQKTVGYTLNRAYQSYRQPGSSIKPLIVYAPLLERGYTPDTIVDDKKTEDGPKNSSGTYSGKITLRKAVEQSKNTVAWNLFTELTPNVGLQYLLNMNFARISENDYYPAASLGGFTNGVSTVEMASAFAALENDGVFREPTCIVSIVDSRGNEVVGNTQETKVIYDKNAARTMTDILTGVITNGTGRGLGIPGMSSAGKTGTTDDKKDGWFVGYTPYYTTSVWVGYDIPKQLDSLAGSTYPGSIWNKFMVQIHEGLSDPGFKGYVKKEPVKEPEETEEPEDFSIDDDLQDEPEEDIPLDDDDFEDLDEPLDGEEDPSENGEDNTDEPDGDFNYGDDDEDDSEPEPEPDPEPSDEPEETPEPPADEPSEGTDDEPVG